jgi:hypothetical protein
MGKLVWLASYPKSGNTWLRAFLHNLLTNAERPVPIDDLTIFCQQDSDGQWVEALTRKRPSDLTLEEFAALRPKIHMGLTHTHPDSVFVKTHNAFTIDRGTSTITMEVTAGAIYIVRNPLDLAISYAKHFGKSIDDAIELMASNMRTENTEGMSYEYRGSWSFHVDSWTKRPHRGLLVVRYEDLSADALKGFRSVTDFLGLKPPEERLERAIRFSSFDSLRAQEEAGGFKERPAVAERFFRQGKVDAWRDVLNREQVARIVARHRAQMARFGYIPEQY